MKTKASMAVLAGVLLTSNLVWATSAKETAEFFSAHSCTASEYETFEHSEGDAMPLVDSQEIKPALAQMSASGVVRVAFSDGEAVDLSASVAVDGAYDLSITALKSRFILSGYDSQGQVTASETRAEHGNVITLAVPSMSRVYTVSCD